MESVEAQGTRAATLHPQLSPRLRELLLSRLVPGAFFGVFCGAKAMLVGSAAAALLGASDLPSATYVSLRLADQVLGLAYFGLLAFLCVIRLPRRGGRGGLATFAVAMFASFAVMLAGILPDRQYRAQALIVGDLILAVGLAYSVWALLWLRRSFSILPEARRLVTGGPYALTRHPLYLGEAVAAVGVLIPMAGWLGVTLALSVAATQLVRIRWEEAVLTTEFPEYSEYARRVPRYLPFLG